LRQALAGKQILGHADVHQLPSHMGSSRSWPPGERRLRIGQLLEVGEQIQRSTAVELIILDKMLDGGAHGESLEAGE
jgi:hypothetical protein